jgi:hypothetical protein
MSFHDVKGPTDNNFEWCFGWGKGRDESQRFVVEIEGECERLVVPKEYCYLLKRPPVMSKDTPFDLSLVWRKGFVLHANNDGLKGWTACELTGFERYFYRIQITDTHESYSTVEGKFVIVQPSELWLRILEETFEQDNPDATDTTMNEVQTDATDTVQDLAGAAENIDLNQE